MNNSMMDQHQALIELFTKLLRPGAIPASSLHAVLQEAASRAGWSIPSVKAKRRQTLAGRGRAKQSHQDMAVRRVFVAWIFRTLPARLQAAPLSAGTAQAIIGRLDRLNLPRKPPMTERTIKADIRFLKDNGNFGI